MNHPPTTYSFHSLYSSIHHILPFTIFFHSPYSSIHHILPFTIFFHSPYSSIHHLLPFTIFFHSPFSSIHHILPFTIFFHSPSSSIHHILPFTFFLHSAFFFNPPFFLHRSVRLRWCRPAWYVAFGVRQKEEEKVALFLCRFILILPYLSHSSTTLQPPLNHPSTTPQPLLNHTSTTPQPPLLPSFSFYLHTSPIFIIFPSPLLLPPHSPPSTYFSHPITTSKLSLPYFHHLHHNLFHLYFHHHHSPSTPTSASPPTQAGVVG